MKINLLMMGLAVVMSACGGDVEFGAARPVWPKGEERTMNAFYRFRCEFETREDAKAVLRLTAGYDYKAWLGGEFVAFGPVRTAPGFFRVDEWPLKAKAGRNVLEIDVAGYNCNNFYLPDQTPFLQAEVVVDGRVVAKTAANGDFAAFTTGRVRKVPRFSYQRTFAEVWRLPHATGAAVPLAEQPAKRLLPREWDKPDFSVTDGFRAVSREKVVWQEDAKMQSDRYIVSTQPNYKYFKVDELEENPYYDIQRLKTVQRTALSPAKDGWHSLAAGEGIVFSGVRETAGFPMLKVRCAEPVTIYFTFDELLQDDGSVSPFRAGTIGTLVWHLGKGEHVLEGFEPIALKCARVLAIGGAAETTAPAVRAYMSPSANRASFRASDPALEKIFNAAKASYAANAVDCLTDCPIRERAGWLGDTFFTGRASKWLTGSPRNEQLFLDNFLRPADYGAEPKYRGLVPAVWPVDLMCDACFIPNWDFWFVLELEEFVSRGGDPAVVQAFRSKVMDIVGWFDRHLNADGLLEKLPGWVFVEWSKANDLVQDVNYPSNMMYAKMLDAIDRLYGAPELKARAAKIRETVRRQALTPEGWYCDNAVRQKDGTLKLSGERTEICQYYAFFTGVADKERDALLWKRLVEDFGPERLQNAKWREEGLWARLHEPMIEGKWKEIWPANFIFGTCLRMELLSQDGRGAQIYHELRDYFLQMAEKTGTLWEHNDPRASCCHGFASIAAEYLYRDVLGVRAIDPDRRTIRVEPAADLPLEWCEGDVPLPDGQTAHVKWRKVNGRPVVEIDAREVPKVSVFFFILSDIATEEGVSLNVAAEMLRKEGVGGFDCEFCDPRLPEYLATGLKPVNFYGHMKFLGADGGKAQAEALVAKAVACGCGRIMILPDDFTDGKPNEVEFEKIIEGLRHIASLARSKGVTPTVEPFGNWRNACSYSKYLKRILAAVPELSLALDTGNFHYAGRGDDIVELAEFAARRIAHVHLKDWKKGVPPLEPSGKRNYETLGAGGVPNERLVRYVKGLGYDGWWTLEHPLKGNTFGDVRRQIGVLKSWLGN